MNNEVEKLSAAFKRMIHVLTAGNNRPSDYAGIMLFRAEVHILELIGKNPGITSSSITAKMNVTKGAVSQITAKLFAKNLIIKSPSIHDIKTLELYLTDKGKEVFICHETRERALKKRIISEAGNIKPEEINRLISIVDVMTDFMKD